MCLMYVCIFAIITSTFSRRQRSRETMMLITRREYDSQPGCIIVMSPELLTLKCEVTHVAKDLRTIKLSLVAGQGLQPELMWVAYRMLPSRLRCSLNTAARNKATPALDFAIHGKPFRILGIWDSQDKRTIPLCANEEAALALLSRPS
jgi:hypothetical protein